MDTEMLQNEASSPEVSQETISDAGSSRDISSDTAAAIAEIEKFAKFKFQGQEWTPKDLEKAILRQKDYTQKTQKLSEDRKSFEDNQKYYKNLFADIRYIQNNPSQQQQLIQKFMEIYPRDFHQILQSELQQSMGQSQQASQQQSQNQFDPRNIELMSRLQDVEKHFQQQEVAKNTSEINTTIKDLSAKYSDAIPELVIGRVYEAYNQLLQENPSAQLSREMWEDTFKSVDAEMKNLVKTKYGELVKKQTEANSRGKSPDAGGGAIGRAPNKFKSLKDVTDFAVKDLSGR